MQDSSYAVHADFNKTIDTGGSSTVFYQLRLGAQGILKNFQENSKFEGWVMQAEYYEMVDAMRRHYDEFGTDDFTNPDFDANLARHLAGRRDEL